MIDAVTCTHSITLDLARRNKAAIEVIEGDTANVLNVKVVENGDPIRLDDAALITITYSGGGMQEMVVSEDGRYAYARINSACLEVGLNFAEIAIYSGADCLISAASLTISVKQTLKSNDITAPDPAYPALTTLIREICAESGGGNTPYDVATDAEVNEMLNAVFGSAGPAESNT